MRKTRIYIDHCLTIGLKLALPIQASEHVARVLRMRAGERLFLFNGNGNDYLALILNSNNRSVQVQIETELPLTNESPLRLILAQALARGEKMDLVIQKATELGITQIVPLQTERSEVRLNASRANKRLMHWRTIAAHACEQSGRAILPLIEPAQPLEQWLAHLSNTSAKRLMLLPEGNSQLAELAFPNHEGLLVVGPEGGLGEKDVRILHKAGFVGLKLGPRILRTETAGLAALAALQAKYGDL